MMAPRTSHDTAVLDDDDFGVEELDTPKKQEATKIKHPRNVSFPEEDVERTTGRTHPQVHGNSTRQVRSEMSSTATLDSDDPRVGHFEKAEYVTSPDTVVSNKQSHHNRHSHHHGSNLSVSESRRTDGSRISESEMHHRETLAHVRTKIGLPAEAPITDEGHDAHEHLTWSSIRVMFREPFAEFFGTFVMVLFGNGSVAQVLLSNSDTTNATSAPGGQGFGSYQSINWGYVVFVDSSSTKCEQDADHEFVDGH